MPPPKRANPKEEFFERAQRLLEDAQNSSDPALKKLRLDAAKRYLTEDSLGTAKVPPRNAFYTGLAVILILAAITIYAGVRLSGTAFAAVLIACAFFAILVFLLVLSFSGAMTESLISKTIVRLWDKLLAKFGKVSS